MIGLLLLACADPELDPIAAALTDFDRGQQAAAVEDWPLAISAFEDALQDHPRSPSLHLWLAHAQAESGDLSMARQTLDRGIGFESQHVTLRYNRAAYAARDQDLEAAAADLRYLYARELLDPYVAGEDDDFRTLGVIPRFAELAPVPQVEVSVTQPDGPLLRDEPFVVEVLLRSRTDQPITVDVEPHSAHLVHRQTREDIIGEGMGWTMRRLSVTFQAPVEGEAFGGTVTFRAHRSKAVVDGLALTVTRLPGQAERTVPDSPPTPAIWLPSALFDQHEPPWIGRLPDGRVAAVLPPEMDGRIQGGEPVVLEMRRMGQTERKIIVAEAPANTDVTLLRGGREVIRERIP